MKLPFRRYVFLLLACLYAVGLASGAAAQGAVVGRIQTSVGSVSLIRGNATTAVTRGDLDLRMGDTVRTGANGRARVVTTDGKRATLGPNSSVTLGRGANPNAWRVNTGRAVIWATGRGRTEVGTPAAQAAVEGTGFELVVAEDGTTTLTVAEGTVSFGNEQGVVSVRQDQSSVARPGEAPSRPIAADVSGVILFEGSIENLPVPLELPRSFVPAPDRAQAFGVVLTALSERRPDLAEPGLRSLGTGAPDSAELALATGLHQLAQGRAVEASAPLERAAQLADASAWGPTYLGLALLRQGRLADAETALREAIRREPGTHAAHAYLGTVLLARGLTAEAEASARKAVELNSESALSRETLGTVYLFTGKAPLAAAELQRALEINPLSPSGHLQLAKARAAVDDLEGAMRSAAHAVALDPGNASAHATLGVLFMAGKDADRAEREFRYALKLAPNLASARTGLGAVAAQRGRFSLALQEQKAALALDEGSAQAHNNLGVALTSRGSLEAAVRELRRAIELAPNYALAYSNLAIAYVELNRYAEAVEAGEKAVQLGERSPLAHTTLARVYLRQRRFERALAQLRRAAAVDPDYPLQHFYLAQLYLQQGRDRDSLRSLFRGLVLDPATMTEQRLFARTEFTVAAGNRGTFERSEKTDGRALDGKLSYFLSNAASQQDGKYRNDDYNLDYYQGILGYQPTPRLNLVLFSSLIDADGGRPGRETLDGVETPLFRQDLNGTDLQLFGRYAVRPRTALTLKTGFRRLSLLGSDPLETFVFRDFRSREANLFAEARLDHELDRRSRLVSGISWAANRRNFNGTVPVIPGPGRLSVANSDRPDLVTGYLEFQHRVSDRTDFLIGPYVGLQSGTGGILLPKFVGRHRFGSDDQSGTLALLAYPTFLERNADLLPVEAWARPFDISRLGLADGGYLMNYEATYQRPWGRGSVFTATGFYRRGHDLLIPLVDGNRAGLVSRAFFRRPELYGGELAYEQWLTRSLTARVYGLFQETNSGGEQLPYFPRWSAGARLDYLDRSGFRSYLAANYVGQRRHIPFVGGPGRMLGGFVSVDFRLEYQFDIRRSVFLELRDLLDRSPAFYSGYPTQGRTIIAGVEIRL